MIKNFVEAYLINPVIALLIILGIVFQSWYFWENVDLRPQVRADFFFSKNSKIHKNDKRIYKKFLVSESIVLALPYKNIKDPAYIKHVKKITAELEKIKGVQSVMSMTKGPDDIRAATENPMWTRFLDTKTGKSSLIIAFIEKERISAIVRDAKKLIKRNKSKKFPIFISGIPYIVDEMRRMLSHDMKQFIVGAVAISSIVLLVIFLSFLVTVGAAITAISAACLTLIIQHLLGVPVGILTANLGAIVYVLTISHIVFLTSNWQQSKTGNKKTRLAETILMTLPASFWAMATTLMGFVSLIFVEAKPLQQLGVGGSIGTLSAFLLTYIFFPIFLRFSRTPKLQAEEEDFRFILPFKLWFGLPLASAILAGSFYLIYNHGLSVDTDPSLLTYFKETQDIHKGIKKLDEVGGSNPVNLVVSDRKGRKLTSSELYQKMQALQKDLEAHPDVGSVLSLPVLMEESQTNWLARLMPWGTVLNILSRKQYGEVARGFVTKDYKQALYVVRMKETGRKRERKPIVSEILAKPRKHGLRLDLVGGPYYMQSELSQKIKSSMQQGIQALLFLFAVIILVLSLSMTISVYACLSIVAVAAAFLGGLGYFRVPVDIISSPTINIILGLAVDGMIHLILAAKRLSTSRAFRTDRRGWRLAIKSQGKAILISGIVIGAGFSVFYLSNFPPSQRFGLEIVCGSIMAMLTTLFVLPHLALIFRRLAPQEKADKKSNVTPLRPTA